MRRRRGAGMIPCMNQQSSGTRQGSLARAAAAVRSVTDFKPDVALVLGSGLGPLADEIEAHGVLAYSDIPDMPLSSAPGHAGRLVLGELAGRRVVAMQGRLHPYEGYPASDVVFPIELMHELGARSLVVTNACGGLDPNFRAGEQMLQIDFINFTGQNPLIGPNDDRYPRFLVTYGAYDPEYLELARQTALEERITLREGIYLAISGPSYATQAELRMFRTLGADAVGMSTVFEVLKARHMGMRVLGLSTITDMAVADQGHHATGDEVLEMAARSGETFRRLVRAVLPKL